MFQHICPNYWLITKTRGSPVKKQEQNDWIETLITEHLGGDRLYSLSPGKLLNTKKKKQPSEKLNRAWFCYNILSKCNFQPQMTGYAGSHICKWEKTHSRNGF